MHLIHRMWRAMTALGGLLILMSLAAGVGTTSVLAITPTPTNAPPPRPTLEPTATSTPTTEPTVIPTSIPTDVPTGVPTGVPTATAPPAPTSTGNNNDNDSSGAPGRIVGTVINLTTGAPAPGIVVQIGHVFATTDANGNYDSREIDPGEYVVELELTAAQGVPAQEPITLILDSGERLVQHLSFQTPVPATATTVPTMVLPSPAPSEPTAIPPASPAPTGPVMLPDTGASSGAGWLAAALIAGMLALGLILVLASRGRAAYNTAKRD